jgi:hypothetical protein
MQIRTIAITVAAARDVVFNFLADIENLPKWAVDFCERIELRRDGWLAYTSQGDVMMTADADDRTGIIDLRFGSSTGQPGLFLLRVVLLAGKSTMVSFTFIQPPALSDEHYELQYQTWLGVLQGLIRRFGGGELHAPQEAWKLGALGLN